MYTHSLTPQPEVDLTDDFELGAKPTSDQSSSLKMDRPMYGGIGNGTSDNEVATDGKDKGVELPVLEDKGVTTHARGTYDPKTGLYTLAKNAGGEKFETLYSISKRFGLTVAELRKLNGIDENSDSLRGFTTLKLVDEAVTVNTQTAQKTTEDKDLPTLSDFASMWREATKTTANVVVMEEDGSTKAKGMDDNADGLDDAYKLNADASKNADLHVLKVKNLKDLVQKLKALKEDKNIRIGNLYFSSHGSYWTPSFYIGSPYQDKDKSKWSNDNKISQSNVGNLKVLAPLLDEKTKVILMACHTGGGKDPKASKKFIQSVSNNLGVEVYANRSWGLASNKNFTGNLYAYLSGLYSDDAATLAKKKPNAYKWMGKMLKASPAAAGVDNTEVVNTIVLEKDGDFHHISYDLNKVLETVINNILAGKYYTSKADVIKDKMIPE